MENNKRKPEESEDEITEDEKSSLISNSQQPAQAKDDWDQFTNKASDIVSGSMADQTCIRVTLQIVKVLAYICTFLFVLGGAVLSKGTLLFMTSQINIHSNNARNINVCGATLGEPQRQFQAELGEVERVGWIWCLFFAYAVPEVLSFLRSTRICFFKTVPKPTILQFFVVFVAETLRTIGTGLLVFMILPNLNVVMGAMLINCLCFVPAILAFSSLKEDTKERPGAAYYVRLAINGLAVAAQLTGLILWAAIYYDEVRHSLLHPVALILISCGWWENFINPTKKPAVAKFLRDLKESRDYTFLYVSVWKIACFFLIMLLVTSIEYESADPVGNLFDMFNASFSSRTINIREVPSPLVDSIPELPDLPPFEVTSSSALWVLLIHALGSYICYVTGKFACRILIQEIGFALPVTITVPVVISLLITFRGLRHNDPCYFSGTIPDYLFFETPDFDYHLGEYLVEEHVWVWLLWLLSQAWISLHIWTPNVSRLMSTKILFCTPMYDSLFVDQSLAFNRRNDEWKELLAEELGAGFKPNSDPEGQHNQEMEPGSEVEETDNIRRVYACATMWHETPEEMRTMLKSVLRMDQDQSARRLAQKHFQVVDPEYYEFEAHIFFDDAFELSEDNEDEYVVNRFVRDLVDNVDQAAKEVHGTECHIRPPVKFPTPYGGRLVWTLPGETKMIAHLKNKDKIRHKKRWSQVMYMYYLLGHRLMAEPNHINRKAVIARNTFILALDGDIDFKPEAVRLLLDLMTKDERLGAACGRIHPTGSGPMVWYQKFEYAIGHWLQKATEHVIGCVLCSPGCFSLFRGVALMDDAVMNKYTTVSTEAKHHVQYDQGEDRWLCTLLLQRGYRVEYSAASDAYTQSPEGFDEFYNQRRRWVPSTMANILDLLMDSKRTVKINNNISYLYILYQALLFGGSILGPGTIFLMLVGSFVAAFKLDNWSSFWFNIVPILIFMFLCLVCREKIQLTAAKIISAIYGLVMMAVLVGIMIQITEDGPLAPSSLFFFITAGVLIIAAILHPQEFWCLLSGVVYFVTVPSMYFLLIVYAIFNLHVVSWGTREVATKKSKLELEQEKKAAEEAKKEAKKKSFWGFLNRGQKKKDEEDGSLEFSLAGLCKCMLCTHPKGAEEKVQLQRIADSMDKMNRRIENIERAGDPAPQSQQRRRTTIGPNKRDLHTLTESEENDLDEDTDSSTDENNESKEPRDEQVSPYWIDQPEMKKGSVESLPPPEIEFWNKLIAKYLHIIPKDTEKEKEDSKKLKDLRNKAVFAFFMINALFVLTVFMLQLSRDVIHIQWPFGVRYDESQERIYLLLDPIGIVFIFLFGAILIIQFTAMLIHRFGTLEHLLATTQIDWCKGGAQSDDTKVDAVTAVQLAKHLQDLRGEDVNEEDWMEKDLGRRTTIINIHKSHHFAQNNQTPLNLNAAFIRRMTVGGLLDEIPRKMSAREREAVNQFIVTGRKSVMLHLRRETSMGPGGMGTETQTIMGPMNPETEI